MTVNTTFTMNNGQVIPSVGLGTFQAATDEAYKATIEAIKAGYRHIDTAMIYQNEDEVGRAVNQCISEGIVTREEMFVTTKLWNDSHHPDDVEYSCQKSMDKLNMGPIDLYLIHWPVASGRVAREGSWAFSSEICDQYHYVDTWKAMEKLVAKGMVKSIGVSNFNQAQLEDIIKIATIVPQINQIEAHVRLIRDDIFEFCDKHKIVIEAYAPLGSPNNPEGKASDCLTNSIVTGIAARLSKATGNVLLRYLLQKRCVVLPKSVTPSRIQSNIDVFSFELSDEDMKKLETLNNGTEYYEWDLIKKSALYPWNK